MGLKGRQIVLMNGSQVGEKLADRFTRACMTTLKCLQLAKMCCWCDVRNATRWVQMCDSLFYVFECHL